MRIGVPSRPLGEGLAVRMVGIQKAFGPAPALLDGRLHARPGEVHALLGENGAGKTTLMNVLGGMVRPEAGELSLGGISVRFRSSREAGAAGIGMVHQHFTLVPALTVLENVALGLRWDRLGLRLPLEEVHGRLTEISEQTGLEFEALARVGDLSVGARQRVEILRVLVADPSVLVLDEPTAVLAPSEVAALFEMLGRLAVSGRTVILIAHKLDEVLAVGDRFTVLRGGRTILEAQRGEVTAETLADAMVGSPGGLAPRDRGGREEGVVRVDLSAAGPVGEAVAELSGVSAQSPAGGEALVGVDLTVNRGEIVGVAGVEGNGQRELARVLAGLDRPTRGLARIPEGPGWIPQDRNREGILVSEGIPTNVALALHRDPRYLRRGGVLSWRAISHASQEMVDRFDVRTQSLQQRVGALSGGNRQKVVVGRELFRSDDLLIAENPTRGLDLGATAFVHSELRRLRSGRESHPAPGIVLISTDLDEVLDLSDRVLVILRGRLTEVPSEQRNRGAVGRMMLGTQPAFGVDAE